MPDSPDGPVKDLEREHPVAVAWRPTLRQIVAAFAIGDFSLSAGIDSVESVPERTARQMRDYVSDYGERLIDLPEATWNTSVSQWMGGFWDVLVDIWTAESGRSDMVLSAHVYEAGDSYRFKIISVYVP